MYVVARFTFERTLAGDYVPSYTMTTMKVRRRGGDALCTVLCMVLCGDVWYCVVLYGAVWSDTDSLTLSLSLAT